MSVCGTLRREIAVDRTRRACHLRLCHGIWCSHVVVHAVIWQRASVLLFHAADVARYDVMKRLWGVMKSYGCW